MSSLDLKTSSPDQIIEDFNFKGAKSPPQPSLQLDNSNFNLDVKLAILCIELPNLRHQVEWDGEAEPWLIVFLQRPRWEKGLDCWLDLDRIGIQYCSFYQVPLTRPQRYEEFYSGTVRYGIFAKSRYTGIFRYGISLIFSYRDFLEIVRYFLVFLYWCNK